MDGTVAAGGLVFLKWADVEPKPCVFLKLPAVLAELVLCSMPVPAVEGDH